MFKKLVSNLPFNPSLLGQVSFYSKRLKAEQSIRRLGFLFMALAMFIQLFAVMAPPQKSLASSYDYIISGLSNSNQILQAWDNQSSGNKVAEIYQKFGLTRQDIVNLSTYPNDHVVTNQADYWSIGRQSLSAVSRSGSIKQQYKNQEVTIDTGTTTVYSRPLKAWDIANPYNDYPAWHGTTSSGMQFWLLKDCGNFTTVGMPSIVSLPSVVTPDPTPPATTPAPTGTTVIVAPEPVVVTPAPVVVVPVVTVVSLPNPVLELNKTIDGGARALKPGDQYTYRFEYRNNVPSSVSAYNVVLTDNLDLAHFEVVSKTVYIGSANIDSNGKLTQDIGIVPYTDNWQLAMTLTVKLKTSLTNGESVCNAASLTSTSGTGAASGGQFLCVSVINPCPLDNGVPSATDPRCTSPALVCSVTQSDVNKTTKESTLKTVVTTSNPTLTHVVNYAYDFGDKTNKTNNNNSLTDTVKHVYKDGKYTAVATVSYTIGTDTKTSHTVKCGADIETQPDQPLALFKSAQNITQKLNSVDTLKTKANAGNSIEYTLTTHNSFNYDRDSYVVSDFVGDVAEYADIDLGYLTSQGGKYDSNSKTISWPAELVKANSDLTKKFRATVKSPVPSTNRPSTLTTSYDCVIGNKYGTEINIPINCPVTKTAEYISSTLPNTGPGTSIMIGAVFTIVIAYFFARSRLLGKELELIRAEYANGGGF